MTREVIYRKFKSDEKVVIFETSLQDMIEFSDAFTSYCSIQVESNFWFDVQNESIEILYYDGKLEVYSEEDYYDVMAFDLSLILWSKVSSAVFYSQYETFVYGGYRLDIDGNVFPCKYKRISPMWFAL